jgi:hypothetical protein
MKKNVYLVSSLRTLIGALSWVIRFSPGHPTNVMDSLVPL